MIRELEGSPADPILLAALTTAVDVAHRVRIGSTSYPLWAARTWRAAEPETNRHAVGRTQITQPGRAPPRMTDQGTHPSASQEAAYSVMFSGCSVPQSSTLASRAPKDTALALALEELALSRCT